MIEVLVTIVVLTLGLLGLVGLQTRLQALEMDAYQRSQAMILLEDMANRLAANRDFASSYVTGTNAFGTGMTCPTTAATLLQRDNSEWCNAIKGASEKSGSSNVGVMVGGRGCIEDLGNNNYLITVAWQGMSAVSPPPDSVACGKNQYDGAADSACTNDRCRRVVTTIIHIA